jgi:capsular polysaccharide transport system permease protein
MNFLGIRRIVALMLREMSTTYGRNPGGYIWAILEPTAGIALLTAIFALAFASPALGVSFPIFYATGLLPFLMFSEITNRLAQAINFSKPLLAYPAINAFDALIARFILSTLTQLLVAYLLLFGIMTFYETQLIPDLGAVVEAYAFVAFLSLGFGVMNCFFVTRFPIYQMMWGIMMRPMFLLCGVVFLFDQVPQPFRDWLWYNPLVHVVGMSRAAFYVNYDAEYVSQGYVLLISCLCLLVGLICLLRFHRYLVNET